MKTASLLEHLDIGVVEHHENLSFVRVFGDDKAAQRFVTLNEAFESRRFTASETGVVAELDVQNGLDEMVFIAGGMIFEGASQNRAAQYPSIVCANSGVTRIPVRCAEQGQRLIGGSTYGGSRTILIASARTGHVDQGRTWDTIHDTMTSIGRANPTQDYVKAVKEAKLEDYLHSMGTPQARQVGYIAAVMNGGLSFYADVFGNQGLYERLHSMLHESVAAVAKQNNHGNAKPLDRQRFLDFMTTARNADLEPVPMPAGTVGHTYIIKSPLTGSAVVYDGTAVQVSLRKDDYKHDPASAQTSQRSMTMIFPAPPKKP
ncbi:MAG: DUF6569 family protein [Nanoarchaeota archaeon]